MQRTNLLMMVAACGDLDTLSIDGMVKATILQYSATLGALLEGDSHERWNYFSALKSSETTFFESRVSTSASSSQPDFRCNPKISLWLLANGIPAVPRA